MRAGTISGIDSPLYAACASFLAEHDPDAVLLPSISTETSRNGSAPAAGR